jgi:hypothetical protein
MQQRVGALRRFSVVRDGEMLSPHPNVLRPSACSETRNRVNHVRTNAVEAGKLPDLVSKTSEIPAD